MKNCPFNPLKIYERTQKINGFELLSDVKFLLWEAVADVAEDYSDWDPDHGFGSSDTTYAMQSILNLMILRSGLELETVFSPSLSVVKK